MVGERGFEPPTLWSQTTRSTKLSHSPLDKQPMNGYTLKRKKNKLSYQKKFCIFFEISHTFPLWDLYFYC